MPSRRAITATTSMVTVASIPTIRPTMNPRLSIVHHLRPYWLGCCPTFRVRGAVCCVLLHPMVRHRVRRLSYGTFLVLEPGATNEVFATFTESPISDVRAEFSPAPQQGVSRAYDSDHPT